MLDLHILIETLSRNWNNKVTFTNNKDNKEKYYMDSMETL